MLFKLRSFDFRRCALVLQDEHLFICKWEGKGNYLQMGRERKREREREVDIEMGKRVSEVNVCMCLNTYPINDIGLRLFEYSDGHARGLYEIPQSRGENRRVPGKGEQGLPRVHQRAPPAEALEHSQPSPWSLGGSSYYFPLIFLVYFHDNRYSVFLSPWPHFQSFKGRLPLLCSECETLELVWICR